MFCSIIVPTYNTDEERLAELVASIDAQTLSTERFELVFVDDGSTTDIVARLEEIAAARTNVRVIPMENSGWACRPRNEGTKQARGEWVLYMDHDDVLFPDALRRLEEFTNGIDADVVNPKEVRTKPWSWGWDSFTGDIADVSDRGALAFLPMTPHKLYRRAFLLENDIAFIEDRRVLWEDVFFNVLVYARGARIAVFSSYPVYHWVQTGNNTSTTFGRNADEMWGTIRALLEYFKQELTDQDDVDALTLHWFRTRILKAVGPDAMEKSEKRALIDYEHARALTLELVPEHIDEGLSPVSRLTADLLRAGKLDSLRALATSTHAYTTHTRASAFAWDGDGLAFDVNTEFLQDEEPLELIAENGRLLYPIPGVPEAGRGLDITEHFDESALQLSVRGVSNRESTPLSTMGPIHTTENGDTATPVASMRARVAFPELLENRAKLNQRWDIAARVHFPSHTTHRAVRIPSDDFVEMRALIAGHQVAVSRGRETQLTIVIDTDVTPLFKTIRSNLSPIEAITKGTETIVSIELPGVHGPDQVPFPCVLTMQPVEEDGTTIRAPKFKLPAAIIGVDGTAHVRSTPQFLSRGLYRVTVESSGMKKKFTLMIDKSFSQRLLGRLARK